MTGYHEEQVAAGQERREWNTPIDSVWQVEIFGAWIPFKVSSKFRTVEGWHVSLRDTADDSPCGNVPIERLGLRVAS